MMLSMPSKPGRCPMCRKSVPASETTRTRAGKPIHAACMAVAKSEKVERQKSTPSGGNGGRTGKPKQRSRRTRMTPAGGHADAAPGGVPAKFNGQCPLCPGRWAAGERIGKSADGTWAHAACASAEREFRRNQEAVLSGETFRSQKPSDWRRGASPSSTRSTR